MEQVRQRCPRLRAGLSVVRTGPRDFLLINPETGAQFAFGAEERYLLHLLERTASPDDVLRLYEQRFGPGLSRRRVLEFVEQLRQLGLLTDETEVPVSAAISPVPDATAALCCRGGEGSRRYSSSTPHLWPRPRLLPSAQSRLLCPVPWRR